MEQGASNSGTKDNRNVNIQAVTENQPVVANPFGAVPIVGVQSDSGATIKNIAPEAELSVTPGTTGIAKTAAKTVSQPLTPLNQSEIVDQIKTQIKVNLKGIVSEVKMVLKPEQLGEVTLKVVTESGIIKAQFIAESQKVKEAIEAQLNDLKQSLTEQGIDVSELSVSVGQEGFDQMENFLKEQEKSQQRISDLIKDAMEEEDQEELLDMEDSSVNFTA
jgi:flagellar hook-length control protein FliK